MKKQDHKEELSRHKLVTSDNDDPFAYPPSEDIYNKFKEETSIDPEDILKNKAANEILTLNEKGFDEDISGDDLDIPDAVSDTQNGKEDEENEFYSLGGDNHNSLEEDNGD